MPLRKKLAFDEDISIDDAFDMAKRYMKTAPKLLLLYAKKSTSFSWRNIFGKKIGPPPYFLLLLFQIPIFSASPQR